MIFPAPRGTSSLQRLAGLPRGEAVGCLVELVQPVLCGLETRVEVGRGLQKDRGGAEIPVRRLVRVGPADAVAVAQRREIDRVTGHRHHPLAACSLSLQTSRY